MVENKDVDLSFWSYKDESSSFSEELKNCFGPENLSDQPLEKLIPLTKVIYL